MLTYPSATRVSTLIGRRACVIIGFAGAVLRARYYDPGEGLYISVDSIGLAGGNPTLYGYVGDVNGWVDIFGLTCSDSTAGTATINQYDNGLREGHFSVEINFNGKSQSTHQVITDGMETKLKTKIVNVGPGMRSPVNSATIDIPNAKAAMDMQNSLLKVDNLGPYQDFKNTCLTHVIDIVNAGGGKYTKTPLGSAKFLRGNNFGLLK